MHNPFAVERFVLETNLSPEECHRRLYDELAAGAIGPWRADQRSSATGWCMRRGFQIHRVRWIGGSWPFGSGPFSTWARGRYVPVAGGTQVEVRVGLIPILAATVLFMGAGSLFAFLDPRDIEFLKKFLASALSEKGEGWDQKMGAR